MLLAFVEAASSGDLTPVETLLAEDAVAYTDGGGRVSAALIPITGVRRISLVFVHLWRKNQDIDGFTVELSLVNGELALLGSEQGELHNVLTLEMDEDGLIRFIHVVRNPEKLQLRALAA